MKKNETTKAVTTELEATNVSTQPETNVAEQTVTAQSNPFSFTADGPKTSEARRLDFTPALIGLSNNRASEMILAASKRPELHGLAERAMVEGKPQDAIDLIHAVFDDEAIKTDSAILEGASDDQLSRLLESRRSDRSKAKKKGPKTNMTVCQTYFSAMYAELVIRAKWNKPYTGQTHELDLDSLKNDQEAVSKKIKSLQSKKSRLTKVAQYDEAAKAELDETVAEIERLNALRPTTRVRSTTAVKEPSIDQVRDVLKGLSEEQMQDLMAQLKKA